jgi:hypothetical protein
MIERGSFTQSPRDGHVSGSWGELMFEGSNGDPFQLARQKLAELTRPNGYKDHSDRIVRVSVAVSFASFPAPSAPPPPAVQAPEPPIPEPTPDAPHAP